MSGNPPVGYSPMAYGAPPAYMAYPPAGFPTPSPATREADYAALSYLLWAATLSLVSGVVGVLLFLTPGLLTSVRTTPTGTTFSFGPWFYVVTVVSGVLTIAYIVLLRFAFHRLAPLDFRFSTPAKLTLLLIAGFLLVLGGLYPIELGAQSVSGCLANTTSTTGPPSCPGLGDLLLGALLLLVGGILALVGYIGALIGIWRLGARYGNDKFKVAAILTLFPLVGLVAAILILVAAHSERDRLPTLERAAPRGF